jgi:uncharacterized protein (DUF885 family)
MAFFDANIATAYRGSIELVADHRREDGKLFSDRKNSDLYWEALVQIGRNNREEAEKLAAAIGSERSMYLAPAWKEKHPPDIDSFFDRLFLSTVYRSPQLLSYLSLFESIGIREHNAYLDDFSVSALKRDFQEMKANFESIKNYNLEEVADDQKISFQTFQWMLDHVTAGEKFLFHSYPINQTFGAIQDLALLFTLFHKLEKQEDTLNYLSRLNQIPIQFRQLIEKLKYQQEKGIVPPRFAVEKSIQMIKKFLESAPEKNIFYLNLQEKIQTIEMLKKEVVLSKAKSLIHGKVYPAYRLLKDHLETMLAAAKHNHGVWALPDGDQYYEHCLATHTTTELSADEIHDLGLKEVARIEAEMRELLASEGIDDPKKQVGEIIEEISKNKAFYFPNTLDGKLECIEAFGKILERSRKELWPLFGIKPKAGVVIKPVPKYEEEGAPGAYYCPPSIDGSRPGVFYVNLSDMNNLAKYQMETLAIHEAEPGHHFQCSIQNEISLPLLRKVLTGYTAYVEGWALYAEKLAYEQKFYSTVFDQLGHLQYDLFRAARLVIDSGIHRKRWSHEKAIHYMEKVTGMSHDDVVSEIERYFVLPGQACAYKIGQLKILELREKAKEQLGEKFDICEFHDVILKTASIPLMILEEAIDQYILRKS